VETASNGAEALAKVRDDDFAAIVLDRMMPVRCGRASSLAAPRRGHAPPPWSVMSFRASENHASASPERGGAVTPKGPQRSGGPRVSAVNGRDE
jgi:DNA-binding response OmpR family regulator